MDLSHTETDRPPVQLLQFGTPTALPSRAADDDKHRARLLAPTIEALSDEVFHYLQAFTPRTIPASKREAVAAFVRDATAAVAPENVYTVEQTTAPIVALVNWAHVTCGLPLRYVVLFAPATIEQFLTQAVANNELATGTARNYRAHLSRIATAMGFPVAGSPTPIRRTVRAEPYTEENFAQWRLWARTRSTVLGKARADVMLALMAGAGLRRSELLALQTQHVITDLDDVWIRVDGDRPRVVPLLPAWRNRLTRHLGGLPQNTLVFPQTRPINTATLQQWLQSHTTAPKPQRLRTSWLVHQLTIGTSAQHLLSWSGIERGETLTGYLQFLPGPVDEHFRQELLHTTFDIPETANVTPLWVMPRIEHVKGALHERGRTAQ
jgi:integrase